VRDLDARGGRPAAADGLVLVAQRGLNRLWRDRAWIEVGILLLVASPVFAYLIWNAGRIVSRHRIALVRPGPAADRSIVARLEADVGRHVGE
jgi:hypothetical protein